ncbi:uncharacterized protein [Gossypium hirsutum]|uniref:RNase H type-1 domain-containing protein n=1 Tax=Gossypium hirsutum TaxID=3635 RepID=A0ABM3A9I0_GOSHI|nr:uncharacterized protein LOC121218385 [Gossypium hirsutum]
MESQRRLFGCGLWSIWLDRNRNLYEGKTQSGIGVANFTKNYIRELDCLIERKNTFVGEKENWKPPDGQSIKFNFDAPFDCLGLKSASGIVARNANGEVLAFNSGLHTAVGTAFDAEALPCFEAVLTGIELGLTDVIVEGDSRSIITKCNTGSVDKSQISAHIRNIQKENKSFRSLVFHFVSRSANQLAHNIAMMSLKKKETIYLMGGVPRYAQRRLEMERPREAY